MRSANRSLLAAVLALGVGWAGAASADGPNDDWMAFLTEDVIEILTVDEGGEARETKVWIVVLDGFGYVRTNDSSWLANIRRGSSVSLRARETSAAVVATETQDPEENARVETAFQQKYGFVQRVMSFFRMTEPSVLRLTLGPAKPQEAERR